MKKLLVGVLFLAGLFLAVDQTIEYAYDAKPEITSIKPGFKAL
ncbi:hypothetical protein [Psychrobacillus sp. FSL K6-2843]